VTLSLPPISPQVAKHPVSNPLLPSARGGFAAFQFPFHFTPAALSFVRNAAMLFRTAHSSVCRILVTPQTSSDKPRVHDVVTSSSNRCWPPSLFSS